VRVASLAASALALVTMFACAAVPPDPPDLNSGDPPAKKKPPASPPPAPTTDGADASTPDAEVQCKTVAPTNRCGLDPQCGCAMNETCDVTSDVGATSCVTAGTGTLGRPCLQTGECGAGLTCQYGACRPYCTGARTKCTSPGTDYCVEMLDSATPAKPIPNKNVCTIACDPRTPQPVCGTNACLWFPAYYSPEKVTDCNHAGSNVPYYDANACTYDSDCQAGYACINHPTYGNECERWCRIGVAGDCNAPSGVTFPPNLTCKDTLGADAPTIGGQKEGTCQD
jgi:hypothetical protein